MHIYYYRSHGLNVRIGTFKIMHQTSKHVLCRRVHSMYLTMVYIRSRGEAAHLERLSHIS